MLWNGNVFATVIFAHVVLPPYLVDFVLHDLLEIAAMEPSSVLLQWRPF
jgi:hypothetical protein